MLEWGGKGRTVELDGKLLYNANIAQERSHSGGERDVCVIVFIKGICENM